VVQDINTVVVVVGWAALGRVVRAAAHARWKIDIPQSHRVVDPMGVGFLVLPPGSRSPTRADARPFVWLFLQLRTAVGGELLISPIGYAMIGKLDRPIPGHHDGKLDDGHRVASLFAGDFSGMLPEPGGTTALATNPEYAALFSRLGWGSTAAGVLLVLPCRSCAA